MESASCGCKRELPCEDSNESAKRICAADSHGATLTVCNCLSNIDPTAFGEEIENFSIRLPKFDGIFCGVSVLNAEKKIIKFAIYESNALKLVKNLEQLGALLEIKHPCTVQITTKAQSEKYAKRCFFAWFLNEDISNQYVCEPEKTPIRKLKNHLENIPFSRLTPIKSDLYCTRGFVLFKCKRLFDGSRIFDGNYTKDEAKEEHPETVSFLFDLYENDAIDDESSEVDVDDKTFIHLSENSASYLRAFITSTLRAKFPMSEYQIFQRHIADEAPNLYMYDAILGVKITESINTVR